MDRSLGLLVIGLIFGGGIGFVTAAGNGITLDGHDHGAHGSELGASEPMDHSAHANGTLGADQNGAHSAHDMPFVLPEGAAVPTLMTTLQPDPMSGWNLHIETENFRFAPEHASQENQPGEGHAHIYVNGSKLARLYGDWYHIATLPDGPVNVEISLFTNDHRPIFADDQHIGSVQTLTNP